MNIRLQASEALQCGSVGTTVQLENSLEEEHSENRALNEKVKNLQKILKDAFETGTAVQDDSNAGQSSSCEDSNARQSSSRESHVSKNSSSSTGDSQGRKRVL